MYYYMYIPLQRRAEQEKHKESTKEDVMLKEVSKYINWSVQRPQRVQCVRTSTVIKTFSNWTSYISLYFVHHLCTLGFALALYLTGCS